MNPEVMTATKKDTAAEKILVIAVCAVFALAVTMFVMPHVYAASGQQIADFVGRGIEYAMKFGGALIAAFGAYEIFKAFAEGGPSMTRGVGLVAAGAVLIAAAASGLVKNLLSGIGSF